jgi:hypothetical protein
MSSGDDFPCKGGFPLCKSSLDVGRAFDLTLRKGVVRTIGEYAEIGN